MIILTLPWPPSVNDYWGHRVVQSKTQRGRATIIAFVTKRGKMFREQAAWICRAAGAHRNRLGGRLKVSVTLHEPDRRKRDLDNFNKGVLDAITDAGVWGDDSQIDHLVVERGDPHPGGKVVVEIEELEVLRPEAA